MFREMRRSKQLLSREETEAILEQGTSGVLALAGDEGYPYAVPISYVYHEGKLYFHCAKEGHKLDAIARCDKASFCVIGQDQVEPLKYTTLFRSVIAFGHVRVVEAEEEKRQAVMALALKYAPVDTPEHREEYIQKDWVPLCILEMTIDHMTGKEGIELVRARKG